MMSRIAKIMKVGFWAIGLGLVVFGVWRWRHGGETAEFLPVGGSPGVRTRGVALPGDSKAGQFPPSEYPAIATERLIRVSLGLLEKNGADLSRPMPSRHRVLAADAAVAATVAAWGRMAGYEVTEPVSYHEHGGVEHFQLDLVRTAVPNPRAIEAEGREVFEAVRRMDGAHYQAWEGAIVR